MTATTAASDRRLRTFGAWAFGFSWALWLPAGLAARGSVELPLPAEILTVVGSFGPMIGALVAAGRLGGRTEIRGLLARLRLRSTSPRWLLAAIALGSVTALPALVFLLTGGDVDRSAALQHLAVLPLHFLVVGVIGGGLDEELGWRGFAQPRLQRQLAPLPATIGLGLIWSVWHLPLWLDPTSAQSAYPFAVYTVVIVGHAIVTGFLYNASGGSILVAIAAHSANNAFDGLRYAVLGDARHELAWQVVLAGVSIGTAVAVIAGTRGRLGLPSRPAATSPASAPFLAATA